MAVFTGNGSAASPSITFSSDTDTGVFRTADGSVGFSSNGTVLGAVGPLGLSGGASALDKPAFQARADAGTIGAAQIILNSNSQGVSASAFAGISFRHQYVTGVSDRSVALFGFRRHNAVTGSQLTNLVIQQRVTEGAVAASVIETNQVGDLLIGGTLPSSPNIRLNANGDVIPTRLGVGVATPAYPVQVRGELNTGGLVTSHLGAVGEGGLLAPGTYEYAINTLTGGERGAHVQMGFSARSSGTWTFKFYRNDPAFILGTIYISTSSSSAGFSATNHAIHDITSSCEVASKNQGYFENTERLRRNKGASGGTSTSTLTVTTGFGTETISGVLVNVFTLTITHGGVSASFGSDNFYFDLLLGSAN